MMAKRRRALAMALCLGLVLLQAGCGARRAHNQQALWRQQELERFVAACQEKNGVYLYREGKQRVYVFFNGVHDEGEGPTAYGQVDMRWVDGNTLLVGYYAQRGAAATPETAMSFQMLSQYDIPEEPPAKSYIMLFENGRHRPFDMVWTSSLFDERGGAS